MRSLGNQILPPRCGAPCDRRAGFAPARHVAKAAAKPAAMRSYGSPVQNGIRIRCKAMCNCANCVLLCTTRESARLWEETGLFNLRLSSDAPNLQVENEETIEALSARTEALLDGIQQRFLFVRSNRTGSDPDGFAALRCAVHPLHPLRCFLTNSQNVRQCVFACCIHLPVFLSHFLLAPRVVRAHDTSGSDRLRSIGAHQPGGALSRVRISCWPACLGGLFVLQNAIPTMNDSSRSMSRS